MQETIKANAELAIRHLSALNEGKFSYDEASVRWLDDYIERLRSSGEFSDTQKREKLLSVFGSYLGECIIVSHGGEWVQKEGLWCVSFDKNNCAYPFAKVEKRIENGLDDSLVSFFTMIPLIFGTRAVAMIAVNRPWWKFWR